jgi:hypothetical protein
MPNFPWPSRRDVPEIGDTSLAALLAGPELPAGSPPELQPLSEVLAALAAGPASDELAGEDAALAAFRNRVGVPVPARRPRRRPTLLSPLLSARTAAAATVAALGTAVSPTAVFAEARCPASPAVRAPHDRGACARWQPARAPSAPPAQP